MEVIQLTQQLAATIGTAPACQVLDLPRSSFYRAQQATAPRAPSTAAPAHSAPPRALSPTEKEQVRAALNSERFQEQAPREVYATLLDEERYLCHWRTMYRVLNEHREVRERRNQLRHPLYAKPELLATQPNELWSWDTLAPRCGCSAGVTKLRGPATWSYFYLYVMLDVYSRYGVGWLLAEQEAEAWAKQLIAESCAKQGIQPGQLKIHADNGSPMMAKSVAQLFIDLGVTPSHSRPQVADDNPYSEAQFKTLKYRPDYPDRFGCPAEARTWAHGFFGWYNDEHHHTGLGLLTPAMVHYGQAEAVLAQRQQTLRAAYAAHPERFVKGVPVPAQPPTGVWINAPKLTAELHRPTRH